MSPIAFNCKVPADLADERRKKLQKKSAKICEICGKTKSPADLADVRRKKSAGICEICGKRNLPQISQMNAEKNCRKKSAEICEICMKRNLPHIPQMNAEKICGNLRNLREKKSPAYSAVLQGMSILSGNS